MARKIKPLIYVFCEGESEIEYTKYLKEKFEDVAVIQKPVKLKKMQSIGIMQR